MQIKVGARLAVVGEPGGLVRLVDPRTSTATSRAHLEAEELPGLIEALRAFVVSPADHAATDPKPSATDPGRAAWIEREAARRAKRG